jgi:cation diffusion facilitator CzcD-associated flavoprotein CzcO
MRYVPFAQRLYRVHLAWQLERVFYSFNMTASGLRMRNQIRADTMRFIENDAPKQYREVLKPNYEPGCKRRVNTATYLAALHSPNMYLAKDRVTRIGPKHVETETGAIFPADILIYATGFLTQKWLFPMTIQGVDGQDLHSTWDAVGGAEAYKGTVVTGFPNFFILSGFCGII